MTNDTIGTAKVYREGFLEGAQAILEAIGDDLPEEQKRVLEKWIAGSLREWRDSGSDAARPPLPLIDGA